MTLRHRLSFLFVVFLSFFAAIPSYAENVSPPSGLSLVVGMGQSNMFGKAAAPAGYQPKPDGRIWIYDPRGWSIAKEPVHEWMGAQIGPMLFMAHRLLEHDPNLKIGLIPCGTPGVIRDWLPNAAPVYKTTESSYGRCLRLIREASKFGKPYGLLTYQGEADTSSGQSAAGYSPPVGAQWNKYYEQIISDLRHDLAMPKLPAIHAQLAKVYCQPASDYPNWDAVKDSQTHVTLPYTAWIRTDDIPLDPAKDCIHHSFDGYRTVGQRFADALWKLNNEIK